MCSMEAARERFFSKVERSDGCWLWKAGLSKTGYGAFGYNNKVIKAHRFSYCLHNNCSLESITGLVIRHSCHTPACINPSHLSIGTQAENINDTLSAGRIPRGNIHWNNKISDDDIKKIRASDDSQQVIAARFGICQSYVSRIKSRKERANIV